VLTGRIRSRTRVAAIYDYVVVGGGTAGCVVAARLAEDRNVRVLLLEAGARSRHWSIQMPSAFGVNFEGGRFNWAFWTTPQRELDGRTIFQPAGRALGGSSAINGMVFLRGHPLDFDRWAFEEGADGWSYAEVLPYFKRCERYLGPPSTYRGADGPVPVRRGEADGPLDEAFLIAGEQAGYPRTEDVNGYQQEGFGFWDMNVDRGVRVSSALAYLGGDVARPQVATGKLVARILIERSRAVGVEVCSTAGREVIRAEREVILSAGALRSPQLLLLSGIGPSKHLRRHGVEVEVDLPAVGRNLRDHMYVMVQYRSRLPITLNRFARRHRMLLAGARWLLTRRGPGATNHINVGAFVPVRDTAKHPDAQLHFKPLLLDGWQLSGEHGFNFGVGTLRAASVGTVELNSLDPRDPPKIDPNYLSEPDDLVDMRATVQVARALAHQAAFDRYRGEEVAPGDHATSNREIDSFVRAAAGSGFHPCGTCRMGSDKLAVCTPDLRVRGVAGLRVVDASVFPSETSSNLNAPTLMVAERASDLIRGYPPLPTLRLPVYPSTASDETRLDSHSLAGL
jgi:choline dehydrogenase